MTAIKPRVPTIPDMDPSLTQFLEAVDRRQLRLGNTENLDGAASLADVISKINEMLETHRTR